MNFKGRSAKRFTANSTNNLKKAWAVQREAKKAKQEAKEQIITDELKKVKYQLYLKRKRERCMEKKKDAIDAMKSYCQGRIDAAKAALKFVEINERDAK